MSAAGERRSRWLAAALTASLTIAAVVTLAVRARGHRGTALDGRSELAPSASGPRGNLLRYLPTDCAAYRGYVDVTGVVSTLHLGEVLTSERMPGPWKSVFAVFEGAHLRPGREIQEVAVCAQEVSADEDDRSKIFVAIGGRLGGPEALHTYRTVVQQLTHAKEAEVLERESTGVSYLVSSYAPERKWIAMPGDDVLVFYTDSIARVAELRPHEVDRDRWRFSSNVLASFEATTRGEDEAAAAGTRDATLSVEPADGGGAMLILDGRGTVPSAARDPALIASIPNRIADAFVRTPFSPLASAIRAMKLELRGRSVHARLELPAALLIEAGETASRTPQAVRELWRNLQRAVASTKR